MTPEQKSTLETFYAGATEQNAEKIRPLLTDGFTFKSAIGNFDDPDEYVAHLVGFCGSVSTSRYIAQGNQVAHIFTLNAKFPDGETDIPMCDVFTFEGNRIASQELFTDASRFPSPA